MGKALKEMQKRFTFLGLPAHGLYSIVKDLTHRFGMFYSKWSSGEGFGGLEMVDFG